MSEQPIPAVTVDLGNNGGPVSFLNPADAENWLNAEKTYWAWLLQARQSDAAMTDVHGHLNTTWNRITKFITQWKNGPNDSDKETARKNLATELSTKYKDPRQAIHSTSPDAKFLDSLRSTDPILAGFAAAWFVSNLIPVANTPKGLQAAFEVHQYRKGYQGNLDAERASLEHLRHQWQEEWNQAKSKTAEHSVTIQQLAENITKVKARMPVFSVGFARGADGFLCDPCLGLQA